MIAEITRRQACVGLMLAQRRWRWANIKTTHVKSLVFDEMFLNFPSSMSFVINGLLSLRQLPHNPKC